MRSPPKKLPFIEDDENKIADSQFIIDYLEEKYGNRLDGHLSDDQKALASLRIRRDRPCICSNSAQKTAAPATA